MWIELLLKKLIKIQIKTSALKSPLLKQTGFYQYLDSTFDLKALSVLQA